MGKVTIKNSNGTVLGTQILTEDGTDLCKVLGVEGISVEFGDVRDLVRANVRLAAMNTDLSVGETRFFMKHPLLDTFELVRSVTFANGTTVCFDDDGSVKSYENGKIAATHLTES